MWGIRSMGQSATESGNPRRAKFSSNSRPLTSTMTYYCFHVTSISIYHWNVNGVEPAKHLLISHSYFHCRFYCCCFDLIVFITSINSLWRGFRRAAVAASTRNQGAAKRTICDERNDNESDHFRHERKTEKWKA